MSKAKRDTAVKTEGAAVRRRLRGLPPPESTIWPEEYRGERWKPIYGLLFWGKCQLCAYSFPQPRSRQMLDKWYAQTRLLLCTNHPASPGELCEVLPTHTCRNFKMKCWRRPRAKPARSHASPAVDESDSTVRRIPVGQGLFAIVDAVDFARLNKHKWYAYRHGRRIYAVCQAKGKTVYMHRMIMRPRKDRLVDHIDGNGLNNLRCNLRFCNAAQNRANSRPCGGASGFVGVYPKGNKWRAGITCRGDYHYLGLFDDPAEAARARDRKARELHGPYAYLNFPKAPRRPRPRATPPKSRHKRRNRHPQSRQQLRNDNHEGGRRL